VDGVCTEARLVILGMGDGPFRATQAEAVLVGQRVDAGSLVSDAAEAVRAAVDPESDVLVSAGYRRHLAGVMARRALETAMQRAGGMHV
jgi:carbon-monoxide dehydrogenase medium subunit